MSGPGSDSGSSLGRGRRRTTTTWLDETHATITVVIVENDEQRSQLTRVVSSENLVDPAQVLVGQVDWELGHGTDEVESLGSGIRLAA